MVVRLLGNKAAGITRSRCSCRNSCKASASCAACHSMLRCAQDAIAAKRFTQTPSAEAHVRRRNLRDALHIAADVADVMVFLHSMDIIHGRLTPSASC